MLDICMENPFFSLDFRSGVTETCVEKGFGFTGVLTVTFFASADRNDPGGFTVDVPNYWELLFGDRTSIFLLLVMELRKTHLLAEHL